MHGNLYGTSFAAIEDRFRGDFVLASREPPGVREMMSLCLQDIFSSGQNCVLDVDVEGVKSLKTYFANQDLEGGALLSWAHFPTCHSLIPALSVPCCLPQEKKQPSHFVEVLAVTFHGATDP